MLKGLFRYKILRKIDNGIKISVRSVNGNKMQNEPADYLQNKSKSQKYLDDSNSRSHRQDESNPLKREWVSVNGLPRNQGFVFTILNYNILSQQLLEYHNYLYQDHHHNALRWNQRFYNLIGEIFRVNPDLCMLQEVQQSHLHDIQGRLRSMNYEVVYKKRTGDKPDGCAIFFKRDLFNLIEHHKIEFEQPGIRLLDRENVAIVCKLQLKSDPTCQFVVATTHLLYNPKRQDIRLAQVQILLAELDRISKVEDDGNDKKNLPIILSGDFNLQPYSAPYNLIVNGILNYASLSQRTLNPGGRASSPPNGRKLLPIKLGITDECQHINHELKLYHSESNRTTITHDIELTKEIVNLFETGILRHNFDFKSVYSDAEKYVSTYQDRWILVDYMFYAGGHKNQSSNDRKSKLTLLEFLRLPSSEVCEQIRLRIPNNFLGSDHLSLAARFHISSQSTSTKL